MIAKTKIVMKFFWLFSFVGLLLMVAASGCAKSHRSREVVYTPPAGEPVYTPVAPALAPPPVSVTPPSPPAIPEGSEPRVYTAPPEEVVNPPSSPPPGVSSRDVAVAESISKLLRNDAHMASISGNVQTTVEQGVVTLRGTAPSGNALDEIAMRVGKLPGVGHLHNQLSISNR